ncbi:hypothetical protein C8J57DRAFT_165578 [Mycena rebaudengoi]|nr:hypothetical protein C8J57DRAFT_165578 [Mycena rebaudengoi]
MKNISDDTKKHDIHRPHSLQDLSISHGAPDVLCYVDLPVLRDLYLTRPTNIRADVLQQLLAPCAPSLCRLHYAPIFRYRDGISVAWFLAMPLLAELDLGGVGARFMSAFTHALDRAHAQTFLPSLQTLRIGCESCEVGGELVAVLASRCDGGIGSDLLDATLVQLKSFHLVWAEEGWIDPSFMDVLSELVRRGMTIHIGSVKDNYVGE